MPTSSQKKKLQRVRQKKKLYEDQGGLCYWCGHKMLWKWEYCKHATPPRNLATWEHLDSRLSIERGQHPGEKRIVLACKECNEDRAAAEESNLGLRELWTRSKQDVIAVYPFDILE